MDKKLTREIGYAFKNEDLLKTAFTHSSYANEHNVQSYERLEFLGDSILSFIVSTRLFSASFHFKEGEMSKLRASIVCERSLNECAKRMHFGEYLVLSKGEDFTGGRNRASILADVFEAVLAAIYLDGGLKEAEKFVDRQLGDAISNGCKGVFLYTDYKTELQEIAQSVDKRVEYKHIKEEGPAHDRIFTVSVLYGGVPVAEGKGRNKKDAEQNAAMAAIAEVQNGKI